MIYFGQVLNLIKSNEEFLKFLGISLFGAYGWVFLHGMTTNFGLVGDEHILIVLAIILGYTYAISYNIQKIKYIGK